jgi:isocitrate dehydrogenase
MTANSTKRKVTVIPGDGIGPECVNAAVEIIDATGASIEWEERHAGERVFLQGTGVPQDTIDSIDETRLVLKGPLETPVGYGEKSANVTLRKLFETYGNIRPVRELPGVKTPLQRARHRPRGGARERRGPLRRHRAHADARRRPVPEADQPRQGLRAIVRLAFELARAEGRRGPRARPRPTS